MKKISMIFCALLASFMLVTAGCGEDEEEEAEVGDTWPPKVEHVIVAGDTSAAATNGPVMVVFSEAVDPASAQTALTFTPQISGDISYNAETRTLTFKPKSDLQAHTKYSMTVSNVEDKFGNVMEPFAVDIHTSEKDVEPPTIVKTTPSDGEPEASVKPTFYVEFSERIDQATFGGDLALTPDVGVPTERWLFTWSEDGKQVEIFLPTEVGLNILQDYTLHIGASSAMDLVGNEMEESLETKFTTESPPHEDIDANSASALTQAWLYIIWRDPSKLWHITWGGNAAGVGAMVLAGAGDISSIDGEIEDIGEVAWEVGDLQNLIDGVLTFNAAVNGTGGVDGLTFRVKGKTVTFTLKNAEPEWIHIGSGRKNPQETTFTLINED